MSSHGVLDDKPPEVPVLCLQLQLQRSAEAAEAAWTLIALDDHAYSQQPSPQHSDTPSWAVDRARQTYDGVHEPTHPGLRLPRKQQWR